MAGGDVSGWEVTVTSNDAVPVLPRVSVAAHVAAVVPRGKVLPDAGAQLAGIAPSTRSLAVTAAYVTTAPAAEVEVATTFAGTATAGGVVSVTVIANDA